jgi:hypothetical protein
MLSLRTNLKNIFVSYGRLPRQIKSGCFRHIWMELDLTYQTQLYLGLYEREIQQYIEKLSSNVATAVDIGAGEGELTLFFLLKTLAQQVFAFEPGEDVRIQLVRNLEHNQLHRPACFTLSAQLVGASDLNNICTLDSLLPLATQPCLIKIDVDGAELEILRGATEILTLPQMRWIIETHSEQIEKRCLEIFANAGYTTMIVSNAWWRTFLPEQRPIAHNRWLVATKNGDL